MATSARFAFLLFFVCVVAAAENKYTNKYDNVDVDKILNNARILNNYIKCLMEEGPCTAEGRELKRTLPDALKTECSKCSEKQKVTAERVIKHLMDNRSRDWQRLLNKYDPSGEYQRKFDKAARSQA
ncbi:ejaculatory bulb-specific protein 3 [Ischnura elegans]|uniref:ejaculatory bulb-specific protein 3 n=1 Tax=Ischnura elegans TaxID=197161 RepID=UPI001ED88B09|nr:ejaculatory bulb-specific protein 3 [Ischnura elegans]